MARVQFFDGGGPKMLSEAGELETTLKSPKRTPVAVKENMSEYQMVRRLVASSNSFHLFIRLNRLGEVVPQGRV